jgi:hypothetical protein
MALYPSSETCQATIVDTMGYVPTINTPIVYLWAVQTDHLRETVSGDTRPYLFPRSESIIHCDQADDSICTSSTFPVSDLARGTVVCFVGFTLLLVMAYTLFWEKELQSHWAYQMGVSGLWSIISSSMSGCSFASWHHLLSLVLPCWWCPHFSLILKLEPLCRGLSMA